MKQKLEDYPYLFAITVVIVALLLHIAGVRTLGPMPPFVLFFGAIALANWLGGSGPGLFATALSSVVVDLILIEPTGTLTGKNLASLIPLLAFLGMGLLITWLFHLRASSESQVRQSLESTEAALERAEEANALKRNFIANMSHEIRAPLSAVLGFSELLAGGTLTPEERKSYLERLKLNSAALTHLVTDLLDVTEVNSAYFVANRKWIALPSFVQEAYSVFEAMAEEKGLRFQIQHRGSIPTYIESDPEQLMQILRQVVGNAIRYSDAGLIKMTVTTSKNGSGRREVAFIISDQGPGISAETKKNLFQALSRGALARGKDARAKNHGGGAGLGLSVARKLARGLGGDVKLAKSDRKGTTVLITIDGGPINEMNEFVERITYEPSKERIATDDPHALEGTKVLVVDDSPDSALLVSRMLETVGASVDTATRGQEGVEKALNSQPDVVLMDIQMPEIDGNEATRRLRAQGFQKPIIALSAHVMKEDKEEAAKSGTNEYLMKPVSRRALLEMVGRFTRSRERRVPTFEVPSPQPAH